MKSASTRSKSKTLVTTDTKKKTADPKTLFETVSCPLCGAKTFKIIYPGQFPEELSEEFLNRMYRSSSDSTLFEQVVQCTRCRVVYLNPRLNPERIIEAYSSGEDESFVAQDPMRMRTFEKALRQLARELAIPLDKDTHVLDVGCAGGAFLQAAENFGMTAIGIEPNRWMCDYAQKYYQLDARPGVLADHHFPDAAFDLVTLWDVIEHVPNPEFELTEINRITKSGGHVVINYPDYRSLPARLLGRKWPFWLSVHLTYYTPETITQHLAQCGLEVLSIKPHWQTLELGYVFQRMTPYFGFAQSLKQLVEKMGLARLPITYWMGQMQVVASKPAPQES